MGRSSMKQPEGHSLISLPRREPALSYDPVAREVPSESLTAGSEVLGRKSVEGHSSSSASRSGSEGKTCAAGLGLAGSSATDTGEVDWSMQNWKVLMPQLEYFALGRLKGTLPRVAEAKDLVQQAVAKTIGGERRWTPESCTLFQHLAGVIKSDISHATGSSEARLMVSDPGPANGESVWPPDVADESPNQEQLEEWRSEERRLLDFLGCQDAKLERMARFVHLDDVRETGDLCRLLELSPAEIANLRKRLKRALQAYAERWS